MLSIGTLITAEMATDRNFRLMLKMLSDAFVMREIRHSPVSISLDPRFLGYGPHTKV